MKKHRITILIFGLLAVLLMFVLAGAATGSPDLRETEIIYRGVQQVVKFDISPRLDSMQPAEMDIHAFVEILDDFRTGNEGPLGPQDVDPIVQTMVGDGEIPSPIVSFNGPTNISGVSPPDPNGDVGPNHVVMMSNLSFAVYDKTGTLLYGPVPNNTLWSGFGGDCQTDNSGDPVVLYDQLADRWILTQFTASGPTYFECVALSQTGDPTGAYYRWAVSTGSNFPDYPKIGVWSDGYYISTREFAGASFAGNGAYAMNKAQMIAGNPSPTIISFLVTPGGTPYLTGDGMLPADLDGSTLPPSGSPHFFLGSMDNGGQYGAPQDALTLWNFVVDWVTPGNSTFTLNATIPVAAFDSQFPCSPGSRDCIPQPGTSNKLDILSYRQRPIFRLAYRNFGTHESLVTNQSVEAAPGIAGNRWWEVRDPNGTPFVYQEGTYAPGVSDGIHRWMGSIAMDQSGNMALGYSASDGSSTFPSVWYTGRLVSDPLGTMPQGEGSIVNGTGSQTGSARWGDYTSMVIDPADDCTFWYTNEWVPTTSSVGWVLRIGSFRFPSCGSPDFTLGVTPAEQAVCTPSDALFNVDIGQVQGYTDPVTLSASGEPGGTTTGFSPNPVTPPNSSTMTIGSTGAASAGSYDIVVQGVAPTSTHTTTVTLNVYTAAPGAPTLASPANGAAGVSKAPTFTWNPSSQGDTYDLEVATDSGFSSIVYSAAGIAGTSHTAGSPLAPLTTHYWRVRSANTCGNGSWSAAWSFTTEDIPPILLVDDDDDSPDVQSAWTDALDALGMSYDVWVTGGGDVEPGASDIAPYETVLWFSGDRFGGAAGPSASTETALGSWLDGGGCLFISSQDYYYDKGLTSFMTGYLGVSSVTNDNGNYTSVTGQNVFAGLGPYTLTFPYSDYTDPLTVGNGGVQAMLGDNSNVAGSSKETAAYHSSFWAFGLEALPVAGQQASLQALMDWCGTVIEIPNINVSPGSMSSTQSANTIVMQTLTISNTGTGTLTWDIDEDNSPSSWINALGVFDPSSARENADEAPAPGAAVPAPLSDWQAPEVVLYNNGPFATCAGCGAGGADESMLQNTSLSMNTLGFGHQVLNNNWVSDDFTVSDISGWTVDSATFYAYQTNSTTTSTMTNANWLLYDGDPSGAGSVIASGSGLMATGWSNIYRTAETSVGATNRPIMFVQVNLGGMFLPQGTYWLAWQVDGTLASGPWAPPITILGQNTTGDGLQSLAGTTSWAPVLDSGSITPQGFPFILDGSIGGGGSSSCDVPEDIPWLSLSPTSGATGAGSSDDVTVTFDSTGLTSGTYDAALCVNSNDPDEPEVIVDVQLVVTAGFNSYLPIIANEP